MGMGVGASVGPSGGRLVVTRSVPTSHMRGAVREGFRPFKS